MIKVYLDNSSMGNTCFWLSNTEQVAQLIRLIQESNSNKSDPSESTDDAESRSVHLRLEK